ncbi:cation diffusion facilitator family transporter [Flavobacterium aciduliphilum]|uniref:Cation diffusion facilitator family transporter n=1 Tax=Flavobacterium aciduliphilum TaxID=1101402 RepID=A0A328YNQ8_9FLAO|nr:cation diffusion facilitator family transporter [Flavobacterium aciduliphilum]RAR75728.1 cation diffusion facilitator family transporter [Flavobacterium aciduliphilum]
MHDTQTNFAFQKKITFVILVLFVIKLIAWYYTNSVAILTDALEYTINVISGLIGLYSLYLSSLPKDKNHPYGHGKIEFLSASIEGTLMIVSSFVILYEALNNLKHPHTLQKLDYGIYLVGLTGIINYLVGYLSVKIGKKSNSLALVATGKHMQSDTYATLGVIVGLLLMYVTHIQWIDSLIAFIFAFIIIFSGYKILRASIAGIMDEADEELLEKMVHFCQTHRRENWIDLHHLRFIKYGGTLHLDCHLTIPWYFNIHEGHREVDELEKIVKNNFGNSVELMVHTDGCLDFSCKICDKKECPMRKHKFETAIEWTIENISRNTKHRME